MEEKLLKLKYLIKSHKKLSIIIICVFIICCGIKIKNIYHEKQIEKYNKELSEYREQTQLDDKLKKAKDDWQDSTKQLDDFYQRNSVIVFDVKEVNYSNGYHDVEMAVKNENDTNVNHVKISLNFMDENKNIVGSVEVISNDIIKPKEEKIITKRVSDTIKHKSILAETKEVK